MPSTISTAYVDSTAVLGNPLDTKNFKGKPDEAVDEALELSVAQAQYQTFFETRLQAAQMMRDRSWPEFTDKTYLKFYEQNEKIANTHLEPTKNESDVKIASGTIEAKLNTLLSHIDNLNLAPEILAFDKFDKPLHDLGLAFTDILERVAEHDGGTDGGDAEKRLVRQKDLLKQGTVFVQDKWCTKKQAKKTLSRKYDGSFNFSAWDTAWKTVYEGCERTLLYGPNVYLGDITQFAMESQPYVFTIETMSYDSAKGLYGKFDNWKHVTSGMNGVSIASLAANTIGGRTIYDGKFRLTTLQENQVEVIKYQDPTRDEFQIQINGVMLLPIGFPLSAVTPGGRFNVVKQILYPINPQFAYGKSFVSSGDVYELSKVLDEMLRLFVLKTRKSITPPYINTSGKIISRRVLDPGSISSGISPGALQPIGTESQGVTAGEFQVYKEILTRVEQSTVGPSFQGQFGGSNTTATEVLEVQRQARLALGIIVSACTLLEVKLAYLRLPILTANYFEPIGEFMGDDNVAQKTYRVSSREVTIADSGKGTRLVVPIDGKLPNQDIIRAMEIRDEKETGYPSQRIYLSARQIKNAELVLKAVVNPKERDGSAFEKLLFREMVADAVGLYNLGAKPNVSGLQDQLGNVYGIDRNMLFANASELPAPITPEQASGKGTPNIGGISTAAPGMTSQVGQGVLR